MQSLPIDTKRLYLIHFGVFVCFRISLVVVICSYDVAHGHKDTISSTTIMQVGNRKEVPGKMITTEPAFNSLTKCVGSPGKTHDRTLDCHPIYPGHGCDHMSLASQLQVSLIRQLRGSFMRLAYLIDMLSMGVCTTGRHWQASGRLCRNQMSVL